MAINGLPEVPFSLSGSLPDLIKNHRQAWLNFKHIKRVGASNTLLDFGADGTGVVDATAIIQRVINLGIPIFDDGKQIYKTTSALTFTAATGVRITGNLRLRPSGDFNCLSVSSLDTIISTTLTSSPEAGYHNNAFTVANATGMVAGSLIELESNGAWPYGASYFKGEMKRIESVSGSTITPSEPMFLGYAIASETVTVRAYNPCRVVIEGLEIIYTASAPNAYGLMLYTLDGTSTIRDVYVKGAGFGGFYFSQCEGVEILNPMAIENWRSGFGYGILVEKCSNLHIKGGVAYRNRHGVDFGGGYPSHFCSVGGMTITGRRNDSPAEGSCLGSHEGANYILYYNNMLLAAPYGIQSRSPNTFAHGNMFHGLGTFLIQSGAPGISVKDNTRVNRAMTGSGQSNTSTDAYFVEIQDSGSDLYPSGMETQFVIEDNDVAVATAFVSFRSGISEIRQFSIRGNTIIINGSGSVSFLESTDPATIQSTTTIGNNSVRVIAGTYLEWRNITLAAGYTGNTKHTEGRKHFLNGTAGSVTAPSDADDLIVEVDTDGGISLQAPDASSTKIAFNCPAGNGFAYLRHTPGSSSFQVGTNRTGGILGLYAGANVEAVRLAGNLIQLLLNVDAFTASGQITAALGVQVTGGSVISGGMAKHATNGLTLQAVAGTAKDFALYSAAGNIVFYLTNAAPNDPVFAYPMSLLSTLAVSSVVGIGGASSSDTALFIRENSITTGAQQWGLLADAEFSSGATTSGRAGQFRLRTAAASFTMTDGVAVYISSPSKGAGSAVTNLYGLKIEDQTAGGTTNYAIYTGAGAVRFGGAVSADSTLSIGGGTAIDKYEEGTFTATLTGVTASVTGTARWTRIGKIVTLYIPNLTGTSNSTLCTITGMSAAIVPASGRTHNFAVDGISDNGVDYAGVLSVNEVSGNGVIELLFRTAANVAATATFTNSGTKGLIYEATITYTIQ